MSETDLVGVLNVNKPPGWTSHDVVAKVRRLAGQKRVGHAGTLDPLAEGVLPVLLGRATRLTELFQGQPKRYVAVVCLGTATATDDAEGDVIAQGPIPQGIENTLEQVLDTFRGEIQQVPPQYSAVKIGGRRAYAVARGGGSIELQPRRVTVYDLEAHWLAADRLQLDITCSSGTYVRSIARDLAQALGTVGHLAHLVRTSVGAFSLEDASTPDIIQEIGVANLLLQPDAGLQAVPAHTVDDAHLGQLLNGQSVSADVPDADHVRVYDSHRTLRLIACAGGGRLRPRIVL